MTPAPCLGPEPGWCARREGPRAVLSLFRSSAFPSLPPRPRAPAPPPANWAGRPSFSRLPRRPPPSSGPAARQGVRRSRGRCQQRCRRAHSRSVARPLLWPAPSRPHAPRPPLPCSPLRLSGRLPGRARFASYTDPPATLGSTDVVQSFPFPKTAGGDAIYYGGGPCAVFFPYNVGRIVISGRGLGEILGEKGTWGHVRRPPRGLAGAAN